MVSFYSFNIVQRGVVLIPYAIFTIFGGKWIFVAGRFRIKRLNSFGTVSVNCSSSIYSVVAQQQKNTLRNVQIGTIDKPELRQNDLFIFDFICFCRLFSQLSLLWLPANQAYHGPYQHQHSFHNQLCQPTLFLHWLMSERWYRMFQPQFPRNLQALFTVTAPLLLRL